MKGNKRVGITSEFVALIKSKKNLDYDLFVSDKTRKLYSFFYRLFPRAINNVLNSRLILSNEIEKLVLDENPKIIINLGSGFSLMGLSVNKKVDYFDVDFDFILNLKKKILKQEYVKRKLVFPKNYHFKSVDLLRKIPHFNGKNKVFFAEGVVSYFDNKQFDRFIDNLYSSMNKGDVFYYNEKWGNQSFVYGILRVFVSFISRSKSNNHFKNTKKAEEYFISKGFSNIKFIKRGGNNFIYLRK